MKHKNKYRIYFLSAIMLISSAIFAQNDYFKFDKSAGYGKIPVSHLNFNNNPRDFSFAMIADITAQERPGVIDQAFSHINRLKPEFVIGIGDFIEGYTTDSLLLKKQWEVIEKKINQLTMPFFFVPGNHDYDFPEMNQVWRNRRGRDYYHFLYQDVLFLVLNAQNPQQRYVGKDQIEYTRKVLEENKNVRYTFLLIHQPLWTISRNDGWREIENLMMTRPHTTLAGHNHFYAKYTINGYDYIQMATTGGKSSLKGVESGEFDHIMWITMEGNRPKISNIWVGGIFDQNINVQNFNVAQADLAQGSEVTMGPLFSNNPFSKSKVTLWMKNNSTADMYFRGGFNYNEFLSAQPNKFNTMLKPGERKGVEFEISSASPMPLNKLEGMEMNLYEEYKIRDSVFMKNNEKLFAIPLTAYPTTKIPKSITVDGNIEEWTTAKNFNYFYPGQFRDANAASKFRFFTAYDDKFVYVAAEVFDKEVFYGQPENVSDQTFLTDRNGSYWKQDCFEFRFEARNEPERTLYRGWDHFTGHLLAGIIPADQQGQPKLLFQGRNTVDFKYALQKSKDGYNIEIAIPVEYLNKLQDGTWKSYRLNIVQHDRLKNGQFNRVQWMPDWRDKQNVNGSGTFFRQ